VGLKKELEFISGVFFDCDIPKNKRYFLKYYTSKIQRQFLRYYITFSSRERFVEHTGIYVKKRWLQMLEFRFLKLENEYKLAKQEFDFTKVADIESGNYKF